jgi:hypothetical protein
VRLRGALALLGLGLLYVRPDVFRLAVLTLRWGAIVLVCLQTGEVLAPPVARLELCHRLHACLVGAVSGHTCSRDPGGPGPGRPADVTCPGDLEQPPLQN